jgi:hypothetical protein
MTRECERRRTKRGSATVEFALSAVILFGLIFGLMDCCRAFYAYEFVTYAARRGARYAMVRGSACTSWANACPASAAQILTYVQSITMAGIDPAGISMNTTSSFVWPGTDPGVVLNPGCTAGDNNPGCPVQIFVQYNYQSILPFKKGTTLKLSSVSETLISQ